jgi:carbonic anhydrase
MKNHPVFKKLLKGNQRYVEGHSKHPNSSPYFRKKCAQGQSPPAAVLACADSRVAPEILFDQGLGDLFVTRVAGNLANPMILGSLEYAVEHLGTKLIIVLGHKRCGAVGAAVSGKALPGHLPSLTKPIAGAVKKTRKQPGDAVDNAAKENVMRVVKKIRTCKPLLDKMVDKGTLDVIGAFYDLDTGKVEPLE